MIFRGIKPTDEAYDMDDLLDDTFVSESQETVKEFCNGLTKADARSMIHDHYYSSYELAISSLKEGLTLDGKCHSNVKFARLFLKHVLSQGCLVLHTN